MKIKELDINNYSTKAQGFAKTMIQHYPLSKSAEENSEQYKPYMHMHDHRKEREIFDRSTEEKLSNMETFKQEGGNYFLEKKYDEAAYYYNKIIIYGDYTFPDTEQEREKMESLVQQGNMNLAICLIKMDKWEGSTGNLQMLLNQAIRGPGFKQKKKGYYWMIKYHLRKGSYDKAIQKLQEMKDSLQGTLLDQNENEGTFKELQELISKERKTSEKQSRSLFGNMFRQ